jgi:hypothetical protein
MTLLPDVSPELVAQAMDPQLLLGRGILEEASRNRGRCLLLTMPEPWKVAQPMVGKPPTHVCFVESMDREVVERMQAGLPPADTIVGLGGGMALNSGPWLFW